jgi:hypothetical protein
MWTGVIGSMMYLVALAAVPNGQQAQAIASAGAAISGHVTDSRSTPIVTYSVIVFGTDRRTWVTTSRSLRLAQPAEDGSFEVASLPPGEYWVAAVAPIAGTEVSGEWLKPESLEKLSFRAQRVTLAERQRHITVLRLVSRTP